MMENRKSLDDDPQRLAELAIKVLRAHMRVKAEDLPLNVDKVSMLLKEFEDLGLEASDAKDLAEWLLVDLAKSLVASADTIHIRA